jgi:peptide subunit release factor 1 (eRF1)
MNRERNSEVVEFAKWGETTGFGMYRAVRVCRALNIGYVDKQYIMSYRNKAVRHVYLIHSDMKA